MDEFQGNIERRVMSNEENYCSCCVSLVSTPSSLRLLPLEKVLHYSLDSFISHVLARGLYKCTNHVYFVDHAGDMDKRWAS